MAIAKESLEKTVATLPDKPGVYQFKDARGVVLYAGKARSLRQRVRSYFQPGAAHPPKTQRMLEEADDLELMVTGTEVEALMLENHVIKRERPRYNVVLRDDKNYPYLRLTARDEYPRVGLVRRARSDGDLYYGPYLPASVAWRTLRMIPKFFRVAICHVKFDGKQRPCLYYHLGQCLAPCAGHTNPEEYGRAVADARLFLEGRTRELVSSLEQKMLDASGQQEFELAAHYRDMLRNVTRMSEKQGISSTGLENLDVFGDRREGGQVAVQLFQMREGRVQSRREFFFDNVEESREGLFASVLSQYYASASSLPAGVVLPVLPEDAPLYEAWLSERAGRNVKLSAPKSGRRRRLLDLAASNAKLAFESRFRSDHTHGVAVLEELRDVLELDAPPFRIECFDISGFQGTDQVASMVVWEGGRPRKSEYRRFRIRSIDGADDFRAIAEAVGRRYRRRLKEEKRLPDLVLIDGGRGQLSSAIAALDALDLGELAVASIAKREEEIYVQGRGQPIRLPRNSPVLQLVQRIRDEAHRFAVTAHRRIRKKRTIRSELLEVAGIGPVTARRLLARFGSARGVREAEPAEVEAAFGARVAKALSEHFGRR